MKELIEKIAKVQATLKAPKNQMNKFGGYKYRSCEDILESVKPLLSENGLILTINDDIVQIGERYYVKATATITDGQNSVSNSAFARESDEKKGMDDSQITGSTSSYARKYALNGLLCIDDTKDADATNTHDKDVPTPKEKAQNTRAVNKEIKANDIDTRYNQWIKYWHDKAWTKDADDAFKRFLDDAKGYDQDKMKDLMAIYKDKVPQVDDSMPIWA